jgi:hypothetical protein
VVHGGYEIDILMPLEGGGITVEGKLVVVDEDNPADLRLSRRLRSPSGCREVAGDLSVESPAGSALTVLVNSPTAFQK